MDFNKNQPIYLQIADYINENILLGKWEEENRILSVREMSVHLQVNPNTVMRSYTHLQGEDVLSNKRGIGYFVSAGALKRIKDIKKTQFVEIDLPEIFKTGSILGITPEELSGYYNDYLKEI